jgi:ABC-2 type transport system permease protein
VSPKLRAVIKREYLERVRTKGFVIATVLGPVLMAALMVVPMLVARSGSKALQVAVLDETGTLRARVEAALVAARDGDKPRFEVQPAGEGFRDARQLEASVLEGRIDGYLHLPKDVLTSGVASYHGRNVSNFGVLGLLEHSAGEAITEFRLAGAGLDPARIKELTRPLDLKRIPAGGQREDRGTAFIFSIVLMMILYTSILMWGQLVMTSVIEEKASRVIEVMASGLPSTQLLWGKLLGVGAAGLTQFLVWALSLLVVSLAAAGPATTAVKMPEITPLMLVSFVLFFLLGFLFYAALYASIGAAVNTVQEAQNFVFPVILPLIVGMVCFPAVLESPDGGLAITLSLVPFLSPLMMFLRIVVQTPPLWQIALSLGLLALAIAGAVWMAARIYRVGILMYGKKPTFPELMKWVRHA